MSRRRRVGPAWTVPVLLLLAVVAISANWRAVLVVAAFAVIVVGMVGYRALPRIRRAPKRRQVSYRPRPVTPGRQVTPLASLAPPGETRQRQPITREVKRAVWMRDGGKCRHCGIADAEAVMRTGDHLQYDHIVPFCQNGADTAANIQLLCKACNMRKGARFAG